MKKRFQIKSFIIAAFFLVAYLNVFAKQASCNLPHIFEQSNTSAHHDDGHNHHHGNEETSAHHYEDESGKHPDETNKKDGHDHHHGNEETPAHHHDDESGNHPDETNKKDDNCCNDKTSAFFESQGNPVISSFDFKNTSYSELVFINVLFISNQSAFNAKGYVSYSLPPPKIPDIRVFIHSFII